MELFDEENNKIQLRLNGQVIDIPIHEYLERFVAGRLTLDSAWGVVDRTIKKYIKEILNS